MQVEIVDNFGCGSMIRRRKWLLIRRPIGDILRITRICYRVEWCVMVVSVLVRKMMILRIVPGGSRPAGQVNGSGTSFAAVVVEVGTVVGNVV